VRTGEDEVKIGEIVKMKLDPAFKEPENEFYKVWGGLGRKWSSPDEFVGLEREHHPLENYTSHDGSGR